MKSLARICGSKSSVIPNALKRNSRSSTWLAQSVSEVEAALTNLFRLHGKRWRARGQTGVLVLPQRQKFHRTLCEELRHKNQLRLWTATLNGQAACVLLSYFYDGRYSFFIGGFEPDLMRWSVGTCLFAQVLKHAI